MANSSPSGPTKVPVRMDGRVAVHVERMGQAERVSPIEDDATPWPEVEVADVEPDVPSDHSAKFSGLELIVVNFLVVDFSVEIETELGARVEGGPNDAVEGSIQLEQHRNLQVLERVLAR
jgi:hypothetical protein